MTNHPYISACRPLGLAEKQFNLRAAWQKAEAAAIVCDFDMAHYYLEAIAYLSLFDIVEERLDGIERKPITARTPRFGPMGSN